MIAILSPAKTLDFENKSNTLPFSIPDFQEDSQLLINHLKKISIDELCNLMSLSDSLSRLNFERYQKWNIDFNLSNSKQAILCFKGGVYIGLDVDKFSNTDLDYSQKSIRILSGLHGVLKPFDLIQPYRLEMGTKLVNKRGKNLYQFWNDKITDSLNNCLKKYDATCLLNLASNEYFSAIDPQKLNKKIIDVKFLDQKNGVYKTISFFAKKARGSMASFLVKNQIKNIEELKDFSGMGYSFDSIQSSEKKLVFIR